MPQDEEAADAADVVDENVFEDLPAVIREYHDGEAALPAASGAAEVSCALRLPASAATTGGAFENRSIASNGTGATSHVSADTPEKRRTREDEVPLRRLGSPDDMAGAVSFLIGEDSAYMTGAVLHVNGGLYLP